MKQPAKEENNKKNEPVIQTPISLKESNMDPSIDFCFSLAECYEMIIETMAEGVFVVNKDAIIIFANQAMAEFTGHPPDALIGHKCYDFMICPCDKKMSCVLKTGKNLFQQECQTKHRNGSMIPVLRNAKLKNDAKGHIKGVVETIINISELKQTRRRVEILEQKNLARMKFHNMVGKSPVMHDVFHLVRMASASNASILITGESGTGKELVADLIHRESERRNKPLVKVNCSALSESLLEKRIIRACEGGFFRCGKKYCRSI